MKGLLVIAPLILVIALGMVLRAKNFLKTSDRERFTSILYWVVLPALLFRTTYLSGGEVLQHKNLFFATNATMFTVPLIALLVAHFFTHRGDRGLQALSAMASARANNVYLGLPVTVLALGSVGAETAAVYLAIALPAYNLISILWGEIVFSGEFSLKKLGQLLIKIIKNPLVAFSLLGLIFAQLAIPVPETILISLKLVADMATGIALLTLGMSLELPHLAAAFRRTWHDVAIKLLLHPTVAWLYLLVWPVSQSMLQTAVIIAAMPTAVNTFIIAAGMGMDEDYACEVVAISTVLSAVTIPLWLSLLGI